MFDTEDSENVTSRHPPINESLVIGSSDMVQFAHKLGDSELSAVSVAISVYF